MQRRDAGLGPGFFQTAAHFTQEGGIVQDDPAVQHKLDRLHVGWEQLMSAGGGIVSKHLGRVAQQAFCDGVAFCSGGENGHGEAGNLRFRRLDGPGDELLGFSEMECIQDGTSEESQRSAMIEVGDDGAQRTQADVAGAGAISDDVATSSNLGRATIRRTAKTTGPCATEDEDAHTG